MMNWKKVAIGVGVTGLAAGAVYLSRMSDTGDELETNTEVMIHKIGFSGLTIRIDTLLKNPTRTALNMKFPFIKLLYKDTSIGTSQAVDKDISIPAFSQVTIDPIMIEIPIVGLFSIGGDLLSDLQSGSAIKLKTQISTLVNLGVAKKSFEKVQEITLKSAKQLIV